MRIIECDRCHKRIENNDEVGYVALDWRSVKSGNLAGANALDSWDFCDECMREITDFVQHIKPAVVDVKPKATIKRAIADGTKYAAVTPEKIEQIKKLVREGKTVKEISELVGVSDPTVRKYKREAEGVFFGDSEVNLDETDM